MIIDLNYLLPEVKKIYRPIAGLRKENGHIEFALETIYDNLEWFPYYQLPVKAEKYINALIKTGEI